MDRPPSAVDCSNQARSVYLKLKERAGEYWSQKKYENFEQEALQAAKACFEWAMACEREMRTRERHVRLNEKSCIKVLSQFKSTTHTLLTK